MPAVPHRSPQPPPTFCPWKSSTYAQGVGKRIEDSLLAQKSTRPSLITLCLEICLFVCFTNETQRALLSVSNLLLVVILAIQLLVKVSFITEESAVHSTINWSSTWSAACSLRFCKAREVWPQLELMGALWSRAGVLAWCWVLSPLCSCLFTSHPCS